MISSEIIRLDPQASEYIVNSLLYGAGLSERAMNIVVDGRIFAMVPEGTSRERANQLRVGGLASQSNGAYWLSEYICSKLALRRDWRFVAQDIWLKPGDKINSEDENFNILSGQNSIYYVMNDNSPCHAAVHDMIRETNSAVFVGFLIRISENVADFDNALGLERSSYIEEIVLSAYDQESFIIWNRDGDNINALE